MVTTLTYAKHDTDLQVMNTYGITATVQAG